VGLGQKIFTLNSKLCGNAQGFSSIVHQIAGCLAA